MSNHDIFLRLISICILYKHTINFFPFFPLFLLFSVRFWFGAGSYIAIQFFLDFDFFHSLYNCKSRLYFIEINFK